MVAKRIKTSTPATGIAVRRDVKKRPDPKYSSDLKHDSINM
ncbi:hypothetical protein [Lentilactobacillus buchneri]|nr:hypothetical protein [Lentilactobacillus buchneri]